MSKSAFREDARFRVLRLIEADGDLTQRQIAEALGLSLGAVNYCLKGLIEKGAIKANNFRASNAKWRYAYVLTPKGLADRAMLTARYLQRCTSEYEALRAEIESLMARDVPET
ncbi:MarR family EPS-associated transcriptional regulator [bacterium]|nr:MarR family EPS-associated transcriptional regulator [bacterium]